MNKNGRLKNLSVAVLSSFAALGSMQAFAGEGNGQGHNGPTLSPISVPGAEERGVEDVVVRKAIDVCLTVGATDRGVKSLLQKLGEQATGMSFRTGTHGMGAKPSGRVEVVMEGKIGDPTYHREVSREGTLDGAGTKQTSVITQGSEVANEASGRSVFDPGYASITFTRRVGYPIQGGDRIRYETDSNNVIYTSSSGVFEVPAKRPTRLTWPEGVFLPRVTFTSVELIHDYDQMMEPISVRQRFMKGLALEMPDVRRPVLMNHESKQETVLTVDLDAYADCLKNEIQLGAGA